ncbi:hypothetical protein SAMN02745823_00319 [Sporobacter termitidis DSM 10068]|uniref:Uncharacterized protein n=1 Tax=Sporobacter termitidis DSM 10068 TaxID=1123282 RepID=A0A1M5U1T9_9FIRM|nr:hypothetical protein [Sporobacter termitidis]SHH56840.1 hypothetical protein SAMN02745823_00319 [Sporobacter termitidis DSM 10068]
MANKKLNAHVYMETKTKFIDHKLTVLQNENGYLYANGIYPTKILKQDLPDWYIRCYIYHQYGYISAKGVKQLLYAPNYAFDNHLYKDDCLYVSYNGKIERQSGTDLSIYSGYDEYLYGPCIVSFTQAVGRYSGYDISDILASMAAKKQWYEERNGAGAMQI